MIFGAPNLANLAVHCLESRRSLLAYLLLPFCGCLNFFNRISRFHVMAIIDIPGVSCFGMTFPAGEIPQISKSIQLFVLWGGGYPDIIVGILWRQHQRTGTAWKMGYLTGSEWNVDIYNSLLVMNIKMTRCFKNTETQQHGSVMLFWGEK